MKSFTELVEKLKSSTFEEVVNHLEDDCNVECCENVVYDDDDLKELLNKLGSEITEYRGEYIIIETEEGEYYKISSEHRENRFGSELPNETVLYFDAIEKGV